MLLKDVETGKKYLIEGKTNDAYQIAFKALMEYKEVDVSIDIPIFVNLGFGW